jgi:transposase-like protein
MSPDFVLSEYARSLSLTKVAQMSEADAEIAFRKVRWPHTNGEPVCPSCGESRVNDYRRQCGTTRWRCVNCRKDFSVTAGTLFNSRKHPLRIYLAAIAVFCNEQGSRTMLAISHDLGMSYSAAFALRRKLRSRIRAI